MRYISNTPAQQKEMLGVIGAASIEDLLVRIPAKARLSRPLNLPSAMAEMDLVRHLRGIAAQNASAEDFACFLGAGSYDHSVPSPINHLISRGEFFTAYTPYQPEASQGTLRSIFEYQTMIAELTGMDVANASLYDGGSSLAEGVLMAHAVTGRDGIVLSRGVNPLYRQVVETYVEGPSLRITSAPLADGITDGDALKKAVTEKTAAVVVQYPNFFGCLEDVKGAAEVAHAAGALLIVVADPVNLGLLEPPGALGADLVVGEGQGLGVPMSFGGPNLGVFAAKQELVRRMPGRLVGATVDLDGQRGFVLTLQTREQHIRARRPRPISAPTWPSAPSWRPSTCPSWASAASGRWASCRWPRRTTPRRRSPRSRACGSASARPSSRSSRCSSPRRRTASSSGSPRSGSWRACRSRPFDRQYKDCLLVAVTEKRTRDEIDAYAAALAVAVA
jgi:glycine dehydrogenase subunit 1